jgi:tetratricopeptide (TPR) repeat protein
MRRSSKVRLASVTLLTALRAGAQTPATAPSASAPTPPAAPAQPSGAANTAVPAASGKVGPNPYSEPVQKGDGLLLARDFDGAIAAYKAEIEKNPVAPLGHYRLGAAQLAKGNLAEAEVAWKTALSFAGKDERLRSKILFALADLQERKNAPDEAIARWKEYDAQARAQPDAKGHPATAAERIKRAEEWKKISADAAEVKARIKKRIDEVDESLRKSSK